MSAGSPPLGPRGRGRAGSPRPRPASRWPPCGSGRSGSCADLSPPATPISTTWPRSRAGSSLLADSPRPLLFGRIDEEEGPTWHIGRRHVEDERSDPVVVDWRAPVAVPFYRASTKDPLGLARRRQIMVDRGAVVAVADDLFGGGDGDAGARPGCGAGTRSLAELERARTGEMLDIVATIQAEQDEIIRAPLDRAAHRAGRPRHGEDRGRAPPGRLPPLQPPHPQPRRRPGARPEPRLPALHRAGPPLARRGGRRPDDDRRHRAQGQGPGHRSRWRCGASRATPAWPSCCAARSREGAAALDRGRHPARPLRRATLERGRRSTSSWPPSSPARRPYKAGRQRAAGPPGERGPACLPLVGPAGCGRGLVRGRAHRGPTSSRALARHPVADRLPRRAGPRPAVLSDPARAHAGAGLFTDEEWQLLLRPREAPRLEHGVERRRPRAARRGGVPHRRTQRAPTATSSSTRPRTSRPCSSAWSPAVRRPARSPCWATWPRRPGPWTYADWSEVRAHLPDAAPADHDELTLGYRAPGGCSTSPRASCRVAAPGVTPTSSIRAGRTDPVLATSTPERARSRAALDRGRRLSAASTRWSPSSPPTSSSPALSQAGPTRRRRRHARARRHDPARHDRPCAGGQGTRVRRRRRRRACRDRRGGPTRASDCSTWP